MGDLQAAAQEANSSGFVRQVITAGDGKTYPKKGQKLTMSYYGTLLDGKKFDAGDSFSFKIGQGKVIRGWDEGVMQMSLGEKARLVIAPEYGYGASGVGPIPPNATLVFEVVLKKIE
eukprot:TRINITY_DN229_c0_g1_i1.p1 TRINITY_DN229_c0_g1~~TRINITY_DN229_c0_g1_i1.p1  ORF type:complete len:117 (-),score=39.29 TRINITY_DN229_c0_g1_i1:205-555(-)